MTAFYHTFTTARTSDADPGALLAALRVQDATAGVQHFPGTTIYVVKKSSDWTAQQITFVQGQIDTAPAQTVETLAQSTIDTMPIFEKALLLTLLDQINVLRTRAGLATVTPAQAIQAVRDKAGTL